MTGATLHRARSSLQESDYRKQTYLPEVCRTTVEEYYLHLTSIILYPDTPCMNGIFTYIGLRGDWGSIDDRHGVSGIVYSSDFGVPSSRYHALVCTKMRRCCSFIIPAVQLSPRNAACGSGGGGSKSKEPCFTSFRMGGSGCMWWKSIACECFAGFFNKAPCTVIKCFAHFELVLDVVESG